MGYDQKTILLSLSQGVEGREWASTMVGWDRGDVEVCYWDGVMCDPDDGTTVIGLLISEKKFSGTLPTLLGKLQTLRQIDMPKNLIRGRIPSEIARLPHLELINLAENQVTGTIPHFTSPSLRSVDLSNNLLVGTIDNDLGNRHKVLTDFDVTRNQISGTIPDSLASASRLDTLSLSENRLSGTLPSSLGGAKNLKYLYLDNNDLMGTIPPEIARQNSPLQELWLQENSLSGTIPAAIADLKELFNFYIDGNKFTGSVPKQLCRPEVNEDFFEDVKDFDETVHDPCDAIACKPGFSSLEGVFPCEECEDDHLNPYLGRFGQCIDLVEEDILDELYEVTNGNDWIGGVNWKKPRIPKCSMTGISCDAEGHILEINLASKGLRGTIPESLGFLQFMERLDLSDNELTGFLISDLRWAPLEKLDVTGNNFRGIVPTELCKKEGINGNGRGGMFGCDLIACPVGKYNSLGRAIDGEPCKSCDGTSPLGSKVCHKNLNMIGIDDSLGHGRGDGGISGGAAFVVVLICILTLAISLYAFLRVHTHLKNRLQSAPQHDEVNEYEAVLRQASTREIS